VKGNIMTVKRDIQKAVDNEANNLHHMLDPQDVKDFKALTIELKDTWNKKQIFRTETEMRFSVLNDLRYPTQASKYWQCVREQNVYLEQIMRLSFEYRRNDSKISFTKNKIKFLTEEIEGADARGINSSTDEWLAKKQYSLEKYQIDLDELNFSRANMELVARDRMREIKLWSKLKLESDDGSFDKENVDTHQLDAYHKVMENRKDTLTPQSSQPEVFNVIGQLQTIERIKKENAQLESQKREAISSESKLGAQPK
jgi:hypothetical protein